MDEDSDEVTYDIFEWFPILVCQNVFKHLDGKDLLQASAVNKEWNKFVAESVEVGKLKLVFSQENRQRLTKEVLEIIKNSKRRYQNIECTNVSFNGPDEIFSVIAKRPGSWKSVTIDKCMFYSTDILSKILEIAEPSVEELKIIQPVQDSNVRPVESGGIDSPRPELTFPCLKTLHCCKIKGSNIFKKFVRCTSLVTFHWSLDWFEDLDMKPEILTLLRNNHRIVDLKMLSLEVETVFDQNLWQQVQFKLEKLDIRRHYNRNQGPMESLTFFLETQLQTLQSLTLFAGVSRACLELIFSMPRLSSLTIELFDGTAWNLDWVQPFPVNTTVTSLKLEDMRSSQRLFEAFVRALPSLKYFKNCEINDEALDFLDAHVPALEALETSLFNVTRLSERSFLPNIKAFKADAFHKDLQDHFLNDFYNDAFLKLVSVSMRERIHQEPPNFYGPDSDEDYYDRED